MSKRKAPPSARGDLRKQARFDLEWAKRMLLETGDVQAFYIMRGPKGIHLLPTDMDPDGNDTVRQTVRLMCIANGVDSLTLIAEAWMAPAPVQGDPMVLPSKSDQRKEFVIVTTTYYDAAGQRDGFMETREIIRGADGKPAGLRESEHYSGNQELGGATYEILPEERPSARERQIAAEVLKLALDTGCIEQRQPSFDRER
jgi:hypothetical protein